MTNTLFLQKNQQTAHRLVPLISEIPFRGFEAVEADKMHLEPSTVTWIWLIAGILLTISEAIVPGFVIIFTGIAAILVAALRAAFGIESLAVCFSIWVPLSAFLIFAVGKIARKHLNGGVTVAPDISAQEAAFGEIVEVSSAIEKGPGSEGRIRYQGTTWKARSLNGEDIPVGSKVRILDKENLCWIVAPVQDAAQPAAGLQAPSENMSAADVKPLSDRVSSRE